MRKIVIGLILVIFIIYAIATIFSISKFNVFNPISAACGMLEILSTDKNYTIVQKFPNKVIFCKSSDKLENYTSRQLLDEYMTNRGYKELTDELKTGVISYGNGKEK